MKKLHAETLNEEADNNYWCAAAGALFLAQSTNRILFCLRSATCESPNTWACFGGGLERGESSLSATEREIEEETGLPQGTIKEYHPLYSHLDENSGFMYHTTLAVLDDEFTPVLIPRESADFKWVEFGDWPQPLHPGVAYMFEKTGALDDIKQHMKRSKFETAQLATRMKAST